jgi:hypothetical protein
MKFQDGFKKKLVQTDFHLNSDNALMTLRKKGGVTRVTVGPRCGGVFAAFAPQPSAHQLHVGRWHRRRRRHRFGDSLAACAAQERRPGDAAQACVLLLVQSVGKNKTAAAADV